MWPFSRRAAQPAQVREFASAKTSDFAPDFVGGAITTNRDLQRSLDKMREKSRELAKNHANYRKYLAMCERNIVGANGVVLQLKGRDKAANSFFETRWREFGKSGNCTTDRKQSFRGLLKLLVRTWRIDGECFVRRVPGFGNGFYYAFQILDSAACPTTLNYIRPDGNRVVMGVELDPWDAPVAYYFAARGKNGGDSFGTIYDPVYVPGGNGGYYYRFPASEVCHFYTREFAGQVRGFPFGQSAMLEINLLDAYLKTELVAAQAASRKIGALINEDAPSNYAGRNQATTPAAQQTIDVSPGSVDVLHGKWKMESYDPQHPSANFPPYVKSMMRDVANGLDVAYNGFANDLESVNFSSMRGGVLDEREAWMDSQEQLIEEFLNPEFSRWLRVQLLIPGIGYGLESIDDIDRQTWLARRWSWVDPTNDATASILQIAMGALTPQEVAANLGGDFEENAAALTEAAKLLEPSAALMTSIMAVKTGFAAQQAPKAQVQNA